MVVANSVRKTPSTLNFSPHTRTKALHELARTTHSTIIRLVCSPPLGMLSSAWYALLRFLRSLYSIGLRHASSSSEKPSTEGRLSPGGRWRRRRVHGILHLYVYRDLWRGRPGMGIWLRRGQGGVHLLVRMWMWARGVRRAQPGRRRALWVYRHGRAGTGRTGARAARRGAREGGDGASCAGRMSG